MPLENASPSPLIPQDGNQTPMHSVLKLESAVELLPSSGGTDAQDNEVARRIRAAKSEVWESYTALFNWDDSAPHPPVSHPDTAH